ncbi:hypothetical protein AgCh_017207 [Apium graveolens]
MVSRPWAICGDFNCILSISEVTGGRMHWTPDVQNFQNCVSDCGLQHLRTIGPLFTWYNKRPNDVIEKCLDRMIGNAWNEPWYGDPMAILCRQLRNTKVALIKLNKANGNLHDKVHLTRKNLADIQERLSQTSSAQFLDLEQNACKTLESCLLQEEALL